MQKYWVKSYPPGVAAEIDLASCPTLVHLMEESFAKHRDQPACHFLDKAFSYGDIDAASRAFGAWLQARGLKRGARVAIMMPNVAQYFVAVCGILRAGFVVVNANPLYTPRELEHQLADAGAEAIVVLENFASVVEQVIARTSVRHVVIVGIGDMLGLFRGALANFAVRRKKLVPPFTLEAAVRFNDVLREGSACKLEPAVIEPKDLAFLQYTGGTTGVSKGAMLSHRNVVANVLMAQAWLAPALGKFGPGEQLTLVCALPLYHIYAQVSCMMLGLRTGAANLLIPNPRDVDGLVRTLARHRVQIFPAVNTMFNTLMQHEGFRKLDFSRLRISNSGGMAVQRAVADDWFALTGCPIVEGYGLTEVSSAATCNPVNSERYTASVGLPLPSTEVEIRDDNGNAQPVGSPGEVCIRGPQVMEGYWQRPDETANIMSADGFLKSGDIGVMDEEGFVKIVDRKKDMILVSGFNVFPNEIEDVVAMHRGVLECAAIGVPDEHSGEAVKLFVVRKDPALSEAELTAYLKENLTGYKRPRTIVFRDSLPKSNVGKILRRALRDSV